MDLAEDFRIWGNWEFFESQIVRRMGLFVALGDGKMASPVSRSYSGLWGGWMEGCGLVLGFLGRMQSHSCSRANR